MANVATTAYATKLFLDFLNQFAWTSLAFSMSIITVLITVILLVFGEITPKTIALKNADQLVISFSKPIKLFLTIMAPIIYIFDTLSSLIRKIFKMDSDPRDQLVSIEELKALFEIGHEEGTIEKEKNEMIRNIFDFSDTIVREIMTPRTDAVCLNSENTVKDAISLITSKGHSRIPIYADKMDNIIGVAYAKDLLAIPPQKQDENIKEHQRSAIFIPETKNISDLLEQMQKSRFHLAIAVDEYGGMAGLVTLEDIIEEIIGEIEDEYDSASDTLLIKVGPDSFLVDAQINMEDLMDELQTPFEQSDDYDTLGGFILSHLGRLPKKGEYFESNNLKMTVQEIRNHRIKKVKIEQKKLSESSIPD